MAARRSSPRLAAWLALAAAAGTLAALAALVVRNALGVVVALVALTLAAFTAWVAATRRGWARVLAAATAVCSLAGGAYALVVAGAVRELVLLALSFALFAVAARRAFDDGPRRAERSPSPERKVLLVNPRSGDGRADRVGLVDEAARRGIETVVLGPDDDLRSLAEEAAGRADVIGMAGGDGSQALVAGIASARNVAFVCVPAGTRNHFALDLGLDRDDVVGALDAFDSRSERFVDLAAVNGRTFVNNVSLGVYAEIVQDGAYRRAKLATAGSKLPELLGEGAPPLGIGVAGPGGEALDGARLVLVSNNPYVLDRLVGLGERPRLDTGTLGIVAVEVGDAADAAALTSLHAVGQVSRFAGWHEWSAETFRVDAAAPVAAGVDGEAMVLEPPLDFVCKPHALRVRLPPGAERRAALHARTHRAPGEVLDDLWHVAAGQASATRWDDT